MASVCPRRSRTPPGLATSGNISIPIKSQFHILIVIQIRPGLRNMSGDAAGSASAVVVKVLSYADTPVLNQV